MDAFQLADGLQYSFAHVGQLTGQCGFLLVFWGDICLCVCVFGHRMMWKGRGGGTPCACMCGHVYVCVYVCTLTTPPHPPPPQHPPTNRNVPLQVPADAADPHVQGPQARHLPPLQDGARREGARLRCVLNAYIYLCVPVPITPKPHPHRPTTTPINQPTQHQQGSGRPAGGCGSSSCAGSCPSSSAGSVRSALLRLMYLYV